MQKFWTFLHGVAHFASFVLPKSEQYYPYTFPEEMLTRNWEMVGHDMKHVIRDYQKEQSHG